MSAEQRLLVHVESWVIGDSGDPPQAGRTEQYLLHFLERTGEGAAGDEPGVRLWDLVADPQHGGELHRVERTDGTLGDEYVDVLLSGDGWTADWRAARSVSAGPVRLRGLLFWGWTDLRWPEARVRGRVERVQVVSKIVDTSGDDPALWPVVPGGWGLREVAVAPTYFEPGYALPYVPPGQAPAPVRYPNPWSSETGVLVALDRERACPVMPDALAACDGVLWVADRPPARGRRTSRSRSRTLHRDRATARHCRPPSAPRRRRAPRACIDPDRGS